MLHLTLLKVQIFKHHLDQIYYNFLMKALYQVTSPCMKDSGMPIILWNKNISTELGIVNGAQGFVRIFLTAVCLTGYMHATSTLIEILKSKVQLSNPPPKYFPLEPLTVAPKRNATDKIWDFSTTDVVIWMNQSVVPEYSLEWFLWGGLQDIKCAWFSLEGFIFEFVSFELSQ